MKRTMAIINVNDDSFYEKSRINKIDDILNYIKIAQEYGVEYVDLGAESTRPKSKAIGPEEEQRRLLPVLKEIEKAKFDVKLSVDTYNYETAAKSLQHGVHMINDISGLEDINMVKVLSDSQKEIVIMHKIGIPETMQNNIEENRDIISILDSYFEKQVNMAIKNNIRKNNIFIDPGIGFGKTVSENYKIVREANIFSKYGKLLMGVSRKSLIGNILNNTVEDRLAGTLAIISYMELNYKPIHRVHDYKETIDTIRVMEELNGK